jgi:hypothetical protein
MRRRALTATALLALLTAAGCSSTPHPSNGTVPPGNDTHTSGSNTDTQVSLPECPTSAAISAALGITFGDLVQNNTAKERDCSYGASSVETGAATLSFQVLAAPSDFAAVKIGYSAGRTVADVSGLGDEAFSSVLSAGPSPKNTVAARKGLLFVLVSSYATLDKEKAYIASTLG